jgi:hypothetical protein
MENVMLTGFPRRKVSRRITVSGENVPGAMEQERIFGGNAISVREREIAGFAKALRPVFYAMEKVSGNARPARE